MFAEKPLLPSSNLRLPPINKSFRRRIPPSLLPPTPCFSSRAAKAAHIAENVSALKAKYSDYTTWLKTSTQPNREPILTQELLKNSLCQMGIDSSKAERLVTTCSWYVYNFQKDQNISIENPKMKYYQNKFKPTTRFKDHAEESLTTISSFDQDDSLSSNSRNQPFLLPPIHPASRFRRVDFDSEQTKKSIPEPPLIKPRLKPLSTHSPPREFDLSSSHRSFRRHGLVPLHTRSILRKQPSSSSSNTSSEPLQPKLHNRILTPSSTVRDPIPLGTRSQRLFGGSEYFAQIMNELEHQKTKF